MPALHARNPPSAVRIRSEFLFFATDFIGVRRAPGVIGHLHCPRSGALSVQLPEVTRADAAIAEGAAGRPPSADPQVASLRRKYGEFDGLAENQAQENGPEPDVRAAFPFL